MVTSSAIACKSDRWGGALNAASRSRPENQTNITSGDEPLPLEGMLVLDFSQFLSGPVAALRLADLGARVIKIERPVSGDIGRELSFCGLRADGDTIPFHAMNRRKQSYVADLKRPADLADVRKLVQRADVLVSNFRPGVMQRLGLDYTSVHQLNPRLVYGVITGYGPTGPWRDRPGQDLLAQALSGLTWLSGDQNQGPVPVGVSIADHLASIHLAQGVTALLLRRERTGRGGLVETSLIEGLLDLQFESLTAYFTAGGLDIRRGGPHSASPFIDAPYGVYPTTDGYLALAMTSVPRLGVLIGLPELQKFTDRTTWWHDGDRIVDLIAEHLRHRSTDHWLAILQSADVWCAPVLTLAELADTQAFAELGMVQTTTRDGADDSGALVVNTTRSPLRLDGRVVTSPVGAPRLGEHTTAIAREFGLDGSGRSE